jgi:hypothetical protein
MADRHFRALALALAFAASPAMSQGIVGKALVEGRTVLLFDDRTWAYEDATGNCPQLTARLSFCADTQNWTPSTRPTPDVLAAFRLNATTYANFIYEDLGTAMGLTSEGVRDLLLQIVSNQTGSLPTVIESAPASVTDQPAETLVYAFKVAGLDVVYANTFVLTERSLLQAQTYEVGVTTFTDAHRQVHAGFLAATTYSGN